MISKIKSNTERQTIMRMYTKENIKRTTIWINNQSTIWSNEESRYNVRLDVFLQPVGTGKGIFTNESDKRFLFMFHYVLMQILIPQKLFVANVICMVILHSMMLHVTLRITNWLEDFWQAWHAFFFMFHHVMFEVMRLSKPCLTNSTLELFLLKHLVFWTKTVHGVS